MKKEKRAVYYELVSTIDAALCACCKFYESEGSVCDGGGGECHHPLNTDSCPYTIERVVDGASWGEDCWLFRPRLSVEDTADIVGIVLANGWDEWQYWEYEGKLKVSGVI